MSDFLANLFACNKQIEDVPNGIVVKDDIEYGFLNVVPLWAFGLNY